MTKLVFTIVCLAVTLLLATCHEHLPSEEEQRAFRAESDGALSGFQSQLQQLLAQVAGHVETMQLDITGHRVSAWQYEPEQWQEYLDAQKALMERLIDSTELITKNTEDNGDSLMDQMRDFKHRVCASPTK